MSTSNNIYQIYPFIYCKYILSLDLFPIECTVQRSIYVLVLRSIYVLVQRMIPYIHNRFPNLVSRGQLIKNKLLFEIVKRTISISEQEKKVKYEKRKKKRVEG